MVEVQVVGKVEREVGGRGRERGEGSGEKEDFLLLPMLLHESLAYFFFFIISTNIIRSCAF